MSKLKTVNIPGHAYFVTTRLVRRLGLFINDDYCQVIINNFNFYGKVKQFKLLGYVIMPTHLHYIIWPIGRYTISDILMHFKEFTAKQITKQLRRDILLRETQAPRPGLIDNGCQSRRGRLDFSAGCGHLNFSPANCLQIYKQAAQNIRNQTYKVWQSRNWIVNIYSEKFLRQKLNYIYQNPVKAGLVKEAVGYKYSSARNYYLGGHSVIKVDIM